MTYAIIGTGAIGGYYGALLARSGQPVHFLLHSDYEYVRTHGLQIDSCDGSFHLDHVNAYNDTAAMPPVDVALVCLKSINNHLLPALLRPFAQQPVPPLVVLIQNGIGLEADLEQQLPGIPLAAGLAFICSAKSAPGRINHQCYGHINFGNYSCHDSSIMDRLVDDFTNAGVKAGLVDYAEARWEKAVWNMPFNGMTVALNTQTNMLLQQPDTRRLIREQMMEVITTAQHLGVNNINEDFAELMLSMTDEMTPYSPSMKLDYDYHRPMEIHYLYSRPLQIARQIGHPMPRLEMLEAELRFLEQQCQH